MLGFQIVFHALQMLFHDIWATVRLTVIPWALAILAIGGIFAVFTDLDMFTIDRMDGPMDAPGLPVAAIASLIVMVATLCWVAVGWHRYALLNEQPGAVLPRLNGPHLGAYLLAGVKLILVALAILVPLVLVLGVVAAALIGTGALATLVITAVVALVGVLFLRISLILPAAALGRPMTIAEAFAATAGLFWPLVVVSFCLGLVQTLSEAMTGGGALWAVIYIALSWLNMALGISVMTTIYGLRVEGRTLDRGPPEAAP